MLYDRDRHQCTTTDVVAFLFIIGVLFGVGLWLFLSTRGSDQENCARWKKQIHEGDLDDWCPHNVTRLNSTHCDPFRSFHAENCDRTLFRYDFGLGMVVLGGLVYGCIVCGSLTAATIRVYRICCTSQNDQDVAMNPGV